MVQRRGRGRGRGRKRNFNDRSKRKGEKKKTLIKHSILLVKKTGREIDFFLFDSQGGRRNFRK